MGETGVTIREAAKDLGIETGTIHRQMRLGRITAVRDGRIWRIPVAELDRYRAESLGRVGRRRLVA